MRSRSRDFLPGWIGLVVIGFVCLFQLLPRILPRLDLFERLEWMTYNLRVRAAARVTSHEATSLGFVFIDDDSVRRMSEGLLGEPYGLLWPRHIYGRVVRELSAQGAKAISFDVLFPELRPDHAPVELPDGTEMTSDFFFAEQLQLAGNVALAGEAEAMPAPMFADRAWRTGDITGLTDADGISRRVQAFRDHRRWNPWFWEQAEEAHCKLRLAADRVQFIDPVTDKLIGEILIDSAGQFPLKPVANGTNGPAAVRVARAYTDERVWHMGIVLAARQLELDLDHPIIDRRIGRITLAGKNGVQRSIPVDAQNRFHVDWALRQNNPNLTVGNLESVLLADLARAEGHAIDITNRWRDKLVIVGSTATGSNLSDLGANPIEAKSYKAATLWNVAHSVLTGRFITKASTGLELLLIVLCGAGSALFTWRYRSAWASAGVATMVALYGGAALWLFARNGYWLPVVLPAFAALPLTHVALVTHRMVFESNERRRIKSVFARLVSPNIVNELLGAEELSFAGARRRVTVFFADVRGFTELTDTNQVRAEEHVRAVGLTGAAAEAWFDQQARETLDTVNLYLSTIAETIKQHNGTLDKYIGDCVMAFWGAPTPNDQHAVSCVRAAIDAQRAMHALNERRAEENKQREQENVRRAAAGEFPLPPLSLLALGTGINSGIVTVGLMGSDAHISNYTVFGREVNLASRLEGVSGRSRIIIGEATFADLQRHAPELAATCVALPVVSVKGFREAVKIYEVPWRVAGALDPGLLTPDAAKH